LVFDFYPWGGDEVGDFSMYDDEKKWFSIFIHGGMMKLVIFHSTT